MSLLECTAAEAIWIARKTRKSTKTHAGTDRAARKVLSRRSRIPPFTVAQGDGLDPDRRPRPENRGHFTSIGDLVQRVQKPCTTGNGSPRSP